MYALCNKKPIICSIIFIVLRVKASCESSLCTSNKDSVICLKGQNLSQNKKGYLPLTEPVVRTNVICNIIADINMDIRTLARHQVVNPLLKPACSREYCPLAACPFRLKNRSIKLGQIVMTIIVCHY